MFLKILVSVDYGAILATIIVILLMVAILYITLVVLSFVFMKIFKNKIRQGREKINVILFQKYDSLMKFVSLYKDKIKPNSPLLRFSNNEEFQKFNELMPNEFEEFSSYCDSMVTYAKKIFINESDDQNFSYGKEILDNIEELNVKFLEAIQLYNTNVIGFNYWRNLFSTKRIKNILFIKEIDPIK